MKPLFTVHAGEYLAGSEIEMRFPQARVWLPGRDTGIDLLVTNSSCDRTVSVQVKYSKDFAPTHVSDIYRHRLVAATWFKFPRISILESPAKLWVLVAYPFKKVKTQFIVCRPRNLLAQIERHHGVKKDYDLYFWITDHATCWETRGLSNDQKSLVPSDEITTPSRNFTTRLNQWSLLGEEL